MTTVVKNKTPIVVPPSIQRRAGIISILPKRSAVDEEYTPGQRLQIDIELAEASQGPYFGPFETADAAIAFMNLEILRRRTRTRPSGTK